MFEISQTALNVQLKKLYVRVADYAIVWIKDDSIRTQRNSSQKLKIE